jgi:putative transposase
VCFLKAPGTKANWKGIKTELLRGLPVWSEETPYQIRSVAIRDACQAVSAAKRRFQESGFQEVGFRSRKNPVQSCYIPKSAFRSGGVYPTLSRGELRKVEEVPKEHRDLRLVCERGRWFLIVPVQQKRCVAENQGRVVALDPGIRSFQTFYSESGCGKLGAGDFGQIQRLCSYMDDLISRRRLETRRFRKRSLRRAIVSMQVRLRNLVDELHHKVAAFLVKNFDVIVLPTFETSEMVRRGARKLRAKSVRSMLTFAHYRFKMFLKHKAFEYGKLVLDQNEAWTSKTVSWTGEVNQKLGGAKTVRSASTGVSMDRDYNGARGIFLRALGDQPILRGNLLDASAPVVALATSGSEK